MKHNFSVLLSVVLVFAMLLSGCGGETSGQVTPVENAQATQPAGTVQAAETEPAAAENPLALGRLEGGIYTNTYIGIGCELDSGWTFYSAEELQEIPGNVREAMEGSEMEELLADSQQLTDMMAENVDELLSMNILYTKLDMQERLAYAVMSEEEVIDVTLEQKDLLISSYAQAGIEASSIEKTTVTFLGEEHTALHTTATIEGINYYVLQVFDYTLGQYGVTISFSSYVEDNTAKMLDLFYKLA